MYMCTKTTGITTIPIIWESVRSKCVCATHLRYNKIQLYVLCPISLFTVDWHNPRQEAFTLPGGIQASVVQPVDL